MNGLIAAGILFACMAVPSLVVVAVWQIVAGIREDRERDAWMASQRHWLSDPHRRD